MAVDPPPEKPVARNPWRRLWGLEPDLVFLNHGSFGATPLPVLERQHQLRALMESDPVRFFTEEYQPLLDDARQRLATFIGAHPEELALVPNATTGVNTALRALALGPGDQVLVTDHEYNASRNALDRVAADTGAEVVVVPVPFPLASAAAAVAAVLDRVTDRTRAALLDQVTSQTGLVLPISELVDELHARGVVTVVDGAHAPGMLELDLSSLGADFYAGNCHKWLCAPKGAGFLQVSPVYHDRTRPLVTSHGANAPRGPRSRFHLEFDWTGTDDPTAMLCVGDAIELMGSLLPGGWAELRARNRELALAGWRLLCEALGVEEPCPATMVGSLAAVPLPPSTGSEGPSALSVAPLQRRLRDDYRIQAAVVSWPGPPARTLRISAQIYNELAEYELLAAAVVDLLDRGL